VSLDTVLAAIDEAELVALTRDLIRIPSVFRPGDPAGNENAVAEYVRAWLAKEGFELEIQDVAPGRPNVIATLGEPTNGRLPQAKVMFSCRSQCACPEPAAARRSVRRLRSSGR